MAWNISWNRANLSKDIIVFEWNFNEYYSWLLKKELFLLKWLDYALFAFSMLQENNPFVNRICMIDSICHGCEICIIAKN